MKTFLIAMTAVSAIAVAAPAAAQYNNQNRYPNQYGNQANVNANVAANLQNRIAQLDARLQAGIQSGAIDRMEARNLRQQLRALHRVHDQYAINGLSQQERMDLQQRLRSVRQQFRLADGGGNGRWADNDNGRWADNDMDGNADGYYGQGGAYQEVDACDGQVQGSRRGGILGGVLGGILGGGNDNCIEAGERAPSNLGAVPYELRNQFRDGNGIVYRSDGQRIYQIDARTGVVLRVFAANR